MKRITVIMPVLLPRISDSAAIQLIDILEQLLLAVRHHYAPQIQRHQRRQRNLALPARPPPPTNSGEPF